MSEDSTLRKLVDKLCPHWYWPGPEYPEAVTYEVTKAERCRLCGKRRIHARVPEPHPTRDREDLLEKLQKPGNEFVVEEWLPYDARDP